MAVVEAAEPDEIEAVAEGDQMAELDGEGTLGVNEDGVLVPACDPGMLETTMADDESA